MHGCVQLHSVAVRSVAAFIFSLPGLPRVLISLQCRGTSDNVSTVSLRIVLWLPFHWLPLIWAFQDFPSQAQRRSCRASHNCRQGDKKFLIEIGMRCRDFINEWFQPLNIVAERGTLAARDIVFPFPSLFSVQSMPWFASRFPMVHLAPMILNRLSTLSFSHDRWYSGEWLSKLRRSLE